MGLAGMFSANAVRRRWCLIYPTSLGLSGMNPLVEGDVFRWASQTRWQLGERLCLTFTRSWWRISMRLRW